jgi:hypothetical protein
MRKLTLLLMIFGLLVVGCDNDSGSDDASDADALIGTWAVSGLTDASGDRSGGLLASYNSVLITIGSNSSVSMNVDAKDPVPDLNADGTYTLNESTKTLIATLSVSGQPTPLTFTYGFQGESGLKLTPVGSTTILLGVLFQTSYEDPVEFTFTKVQ